MRLSVAAVLVLALGAAAPDLSGLDYVQHRGAAMPMSAPLRDAGGDDASLAQLSAGQPLIVDFGYFHCPTLCSATRDDLLGGLAQSGLHAGRDYVLAAISIDPAERPQDAAAALRDDLARFPQPGAATAWHFLTGPAASLQALQQAAGFHARWDPTLKQFLHPEGLVFVSGQGRISGYQFGYNDTASALRRGIGLAAAGIVAPQANPVLLLCFHFDPLTGQYSFAIMKVLRLMAGVTVLALGALLASGIRWRKRRERSIPGRSVPAVPPVRKSSA